MDDFIKIYVTCDKDRAECLLFLQRAKLPFEVKVFLSEKLVACALNWDSEKLIYLSSSKLKISFDWIKSWGHHCSKQYSLKNEPLAKAVGRNKVTAPKVRDLTCGTGKDSLLLLSFGCEVIGFERNKTVFILLKFAQMEGEKDSRLGPILKERFKLRYVDSLDSYNFEEDEVLFYDPMYPEAPSKRKALPRKEMVIFHELVGSDEDVDEVLDYILNLNVMRVVLKRPIKSKVIGVPVNSYKGKSTRYDMYQKN